MADNETESETTESAETQQTETQSRQTQTSSGADNAVAQSLAAVDSSIKGLTEMVAKLPDVIGNAIKINDKESETANQTEGEPGKAPPQQKEEPKEKPVKRPVGAGNRVSRWFYGDR